MAEQSMKKCCGLCPFSRKGTLFVHPERAEDFAYSTQNPYNDFVCHKTGVEYESEWADDEMDGAIVRGEKSLTCKGFESLKWQEYPENFPEDYEPDPDAFTDPWDMAQFHQDHWDAEQLQKQK